MKKKIKLLIVEDSGFMRTVIRKTLADHSEIEIIGEAQNGSIALEMAKRLKPDVITMDIEMPEVDGLWATARIMATNPCPIIMLSSYTQEGAQSTFKALELGAVDFISKESGFVKLDIAHIGKELREKVVYWGRHSFPVSNLSSRKKESSTLENVNASPISTSTKTDLVVIGVSTGGPQILPELLRKMGTLPCPVVVAQHMPDKFVDSFAEHLAKITGLNVVAGKNRMLLEKETIVFIPGALDGKILRSGLGGFVLLLQKDKNYSIHPSVDLLLESASEAAVNPVAVILTGMGRDGTLGAEAFVQKGFPVLVQEPNSCAVNGMPKSVIEKKVATEILTIPSIGSRLAAKAK